MSSERRYSLLKHTHANLYYTKTELDGGQLDTRYYTETEVDNIVDDYLPLTGGTLTGALFGTSAEFSANIVSNGGNLAAINNAPYVRLSQSDQAADAKEWLWQANGTSLFLYAYNDALSSGNPSISINRTGDEPEQVILYSNLAEVARFRTLTGTTGNSYVSFYDSANSRKGYVGYGSGSSDDFYIQNEETSSTSRIFIRTNTTSSNGEIAIQPNNTSAFRASSVGLGFYGTAPTAKPTVTGSRGGNAALASLCTALANIGLITNSTT